LSEADSPLNSVQTRSSIWRMYRDAADQDYLLARFSARSNLIYQFWWNAEQAIEKYLKAALLLNSIPVNQYGHKLLEMFDICVEFSGDLLPLLHCPPRCITQSYWPYTNPRGFCLTKNFVSRVQENGSPDNRYRAFSTFTKSEDLIYFDELCFSLRRVAFPLELVLPGENTTVRQVLLRSRNLQLHPRMGFQGTLEKKYSHVWEDHFRWCNFAYFYEYALNQSEYPRWGGSINAEPYLAGKRGGADGSMRWIAKNAFPKVLKIDVLSYLDSSPRDKDE
jgi:hypothetical protein